MVVVMVEWMRCWYRWRRINNHRMGHIMWNWNWSINRHRIWLVNWERHLECCIRIKREVKDRRL
jgi:hypothetical protein